MSSYEIYQLSSRISYMLTGAFVFAGIPLLISIFKKRFGIGLLVFIISAYVTNFHVFAPLPIVIIGLYIILKKRPDEHKTEETQSFDGTKNSKDDICTASITDNDCSAKENVSKMVSTVNSDSAAISNATQSLEYTEKYVVLLKQLSDLHNSGILTDEEYTAKKKEILSRL